MKRTNVVIGLLVLTLLLVGCGAQNTASSSEKPSAEAETSSPVLSSSEEGSTIPEPEESETPPATPEPTPEPTPEIPVSAIVVFNLLNNAEDAQFDALYADYTERMERQGLTDDWNALCRQASAWSDYFRNQALCKAEQDYVIEYNWDKYDDLPDIDELLEAAELFGKLYGDGERIHSFYTEMEDLAEEGINPTLLDAIYIPGCYLDLEGCVWLKDWFDEAADSVGTAADGSLRVLVVDSSEVVARTDVNSGGGNMGGAELDVHDESGAMYVRRRGMDFWSQMNQVADGRLTLTSYPELADIVLSYRVTYPNLGTFTFQDGIARTIYGNELEFSALNTATGESCSGKMSVRDVYMAYAAPNTTTCWLPFPTIYIDPEIVEGTGQPPKAPEAERFINTVLGWFPENTL